MATPILPWREQYRVHIPRLDGQHRQLVGRINELHASMLEGSGNEELAKILDELIRDAESHFTYEEQLLRQRGYSGLARHHAEHEELTRQIRSLQEQLHSGELAMSMQVLKFLKEWLANHILTGDLKYAREIAH